MVLQLADASDDKIFLGAILLGDEASSFFFGLPPVDLMQSNASLMALKSCIRARAAGKNRSHVYRKSKLTMFSNRIKR